MPPSAAVASFGSRRERTGRRSRSIFPDTGFITNASTRKILVGTDGAGSCSLNLLVTWAAHSAGA